MLLQACNAPKQPAISSSSETTSDTIRASIGTLLTNPYINMDASPLDISYFPEDYTSQKMNSTAAASPMMRIIYGRPFKKGRVIFSDVDNAICQYGKPWRLGANEATEIEFFYPVKIAGKEFQPGRYIMYAIPEKEFWTIVFNSNVHSWGLHIDPSKDVFRTRVPVEVQQPAIENFTMVFTGSAPKPSILMAWDDVKVELPIEIRKL